MFDRNDFFSWAFSDLNANNLRGIVAEYIVFRLLSCKNENRVEWNAYDLVGPDGRLIEVKSTGYVQTWSQKKETKLIFDISRKNSWFAGTNKTSSEKIRAADIYVFCLFTERDKERIDPLNLSQWQFVVLSRANLERTFLEQKTVSWNRLLNAGSSPVNAEGLLARYQECNE